MIELTNWLMVFLRASSMLAVFPIFSARNFPTQLRLALGALLALMVAATMPADAVQASDFWGLAGQMAVEVGLGLLIGFVSRMIFYTLEIVGSIVSTEIGLSIPPGFNPLDEMQMTAASSMLYYLAAVLWLTMDMHHWMLIAFKKTYLYVPIGAAHMSQALVTDMITRTAGIFVIALQMSAPLLAVSFIISLIFAVLGRAVPQMNVFAESFAVRPLVGLSVFGLTLDLMSEHIMNYMRRLPEDMLRVAQALH
ncbi:MAG TPA: flagellar biosynthetic protein FliR [Candidatus Cybelea sp.]|nr:flagellar biosynthetic protein FliR [Candidatus Cybelea sp.]